MFLIDKPYVSDFVKQTIIQNNFPVINTAGARAMGFDNGHNLLDEAAAIDAIKANDEFQIYTISEHSLGWIAEHLAGTGLPDKIDLFKNKVKFRQLLQPLYPDFYFKAVPFDELAAFPIDDVPLPFVIKPAVGFFSMGVHKVNHVGQWPPVKEHILSSAAGIEKSLFPRQVLDTGTFIIEQVVTGEEYALDAYYNAAGQPVILTILKHMFSSDEDVSDRIYISSKQIVEDNYARFRDFLCRVGKLAGIKNFPVHVELRVDSNGALVPIEINPMRFGGWCTTADMTYLAYGFNPYEYYFYQKQPDWTEILQDKAGKTYSLIVLDNSTKVTPDRIKAFDYERLLAGFENPLELRRLDHKQYPLFGLLFAETGEANISELEYILASDLSEFIR